MPARGRAGTVARESPQDLMVAGSLASCPEWKGLKGQWLGHYRKCYRWSFVLVILVFSLYSIPPPHLEVEEMSLSVRVS